MQFYILKLFYTKIYFIFQILSGNRKQWDSQRCVFGSKVGSTSKVCKKPFKNIVNRISSRKKYKINGKSKTVKIKWHSVKTSILLLLSNLLYLFINLKRVGTFIMYLQLIEIIGTLRVVTYSIQ